MEHEDPQHWGLGQELVEDMNRRTQHSLQFKGPGQERTSYISSNLYYELLPGEWEPQSLNFQLRGADHVADQLSYNVRVTDDGIAVLNPKTGVGVRWLLPVRPTISTRNARLTGDGVAWEYSISPKQLKLSGVVTIPLGLRTHTFPYRPLGASQDFALVNDQVQAPGIAVAPPVVRGANGEVYPNSGWRILPDSRIAFSVDDTLLPPEAYPYIIDPTTTIQETEESVPDAFIESRSPDETRETSALRVGSTHGTAIENSRTVIKFDVSSIDAGDEVSSVTLSLFEYSAVDDHSVGSWATEWQRIRRDWVEAQVTWNDWKASNAWTTAGAADTTNDIHSTISATLTLDGTSAGAFVDWTGSVLVTDVQNFVDGGYSNYGWRLRAPAAEGYLNYVGNWFRQSEYGTAADRPKLVVAHSGPFVPRITIF